MAMKTVAGRKVVHDLARHVLVGGQLLKRHLRESYEAMYVTKLFQSTAFSAAGVTTPYKSITVWNMDVNRIRPFGGTRVRTKGSKVPGLRVPKFPG